MSTIELSTFTKYTQSPQEIAAGSSYTSDQKQFLQTQICMIAESIVALIPDANNYAAFIQEQAFLKGQLVAYQYLLDTSAASEEYLRTVLPAV